jgi:hypothetical protein
VGPDDGGVRVDALHELEWHNDWFILGFSPRKAALTLYGVYDDYAPTEPLFADLGPHETGKGCLYLKRLEAVDGAVLEQLVARAWAKHSG